MAINESRSLWVWFSEFKDNEFIFQIAYILNTPILFKYFIYQNNRYHVRVHVQYNVSMYQTRHITYPIILIDLTV
jgi:hypothetical protein